MQERRAAKHDSRPVLATPEQYGEDAEEHVVADDQIGREIPEGLQQSSMLSRDPVEEDPFDGDAQPVRPRRQVLQFGDHAGDVAAVEIRDAGERMKPRPALDDAIAKRGSRKHDDVVSFRHRHVGDGEEWVEMTGRRCRADEDFHGFSHVWVCRRAARVRETRQPGRRRKTSIALAADCSVVGRVEMDV